MTLTEILLIIGYLTTFFSFGGLLIGIYKKGKNWVDIIIESQKCTLRGQITDVYYKHVKEENPTLPRYERELLDSSFKCYNKVLHGNSFIEDVYHEMRKWKVER